MVVISLFARTEKQRSYILTMLVFVTLAKFPNRIRLVFKETKLFLSNNLKIYTTNDFISEKEMDDNLVKKL